MIHVSGVVLIGEHLRLRITTIHHVSFKILFLFNFCVCVCLREFMRTTQVQVPLEARGLGIPELEIQLRGAMWVLETKSGTSARSSSAFNC